MEQGPNQPQRNFGEIELSLSHMHSELERYHEPLFKINLRDSLGTNLDDAHVGGEWLLSVRPIRPQS